jgi:hypothetical protein
MRAYSWGTRSGVMPSRAARASTSSTVGGAAARADPSRKRLYRFDIAVPNFSSVPDLYQINPDLSTEKSFFRKMR